MKPVQKTTAWVALVALVATGWSAYQELRPESSPAQVEYLPAAHAGQASVPAAPAMAVSPRAGETVVDLSQETVGAEPKNFVAVVGNWIIGIDDGRKVLVVDGRKWKEGQASASLADKARGIYGERYAEFLDNVTAYAYYPIAVAKGIDDFRGGTISFRFKGVAGRIDQGAGILFNLQPNGNYYAVRANPLEDNLVLWRYEHGNRSSVKWIRNVPTPSQQWHELKLEVRGKQVKSYVNGKLYLEHTLPAPVSGKVGIWSKSDSVVYFDDYRVKQ